MTTERTFISLYNVQAQTDTQIPSATYNLQARGRNFEGDGRAKRIIGEEAVRPRNISFNMQEKEEKWDGKRRRGCTICFTFYVKAEILSRN